MQSIAEADTSNKPSSRRTSGAVRNEYLLDGAFLIEFETPSGPLDMFRRDVQPQSRQASFLVGAELQSATDKYRTMERKGYRVTTDTGCLIPHEQYSTYQAGATLKGHQRTFEFFARWRPSKANTDARNEYGWPSSLQISHLCHRRGCCRPDHLIAEEQWRNQKRNFCGFGGQCNCGNEVKCLRRYTMDNQTDTPEFCLTKEEVDALLVGAPKYVIHSKDRFAKRDAKSEQRKSNKKKRRRKTELHEYETARKQARLG